MVNQGRRGRRGLHGFTTIEKLKIDSVKSLEDGFQAFLFVIRDC